MSTRWTAGKVAELMGPFGEGGCERVAEAHNAAILKDWNNYVGLVSQNESLQRELDESQRQLAECGRRVAKLQGELR